MKLRVCLASFRRDESGAVLVFWASAMVIFFGLMALIFDIGRMATTQTELQGFADNVALAAAGELDGRPDAITRANAAAADLIDGHQTFADGASQLSGADDYTLSFHDRVPGSGGSPLNIGLSTAPAQARYVTVQLNDRRVSFGMARAFAALSGYDEDSGVVSASATAGFELIACDVTPVAMCLPSLDFRAEANIGSTLELDVSASLGGLGGGLGSGALGLVETTVGLLADTEICAGLGGDLLSACLLAARDPGSACFGAGGMSINVDVAAVDIAAALNVRFGQYSGAMAGNAGNPNFSPAPNILAGLTNNAGMCQLQSGLSALDLGLPADDCLASGTCAAVGDGNWAAGRLDYINEHHDGVDPFPTIDTRYDFYLAELNAQSDLLTNLLDTVGGTVGGLLGGLGLGGGANPLSGLLCNPVGNQDPARRLLTIAAVDCANPSEGGALPVRQYFDAFILGPTDDNLLSIEVIACLGADCGPSPTGAQVRDHVRLVK